MSVETTHESTFSTKSLLAVFGAALLVVVGVFALVGTPVTQTLHVDFVSLVGHTIVLVSPDCLQGAAPTGDVPTTGLGFTSMMPKVALIARSHYPPITHPLPFPRVSVFSSARRATSFC